MSFKFKQSDNRILQIAQNIISNSSPDLTTLSLYVSSKMENRWYLSWPNGR